MQETGDLKPESAALRIPNVREEIDRAQEALLAALQRHGYPRASLFAVRLAVEEAMSNAFQHGHRDLPPEETILLEYRVAPDQVHLVIEDKGPGFHPEAVPDPTLDENLEQPTGRGLLLMRAYMASVEYSHTGNRVTMVYRPPTDPPGA